MRLRYVATLLILLSSFTATAQADLEAYERRQFIKGNDTLPYRILYPEDYNPNQTYPLILVLHGAGERGRNNEAQLVHGARMFLRPEYRQQFPAIVVFPQCPPEDYWSNVNIVYSPDSSSRTFNFRKGGKPTKALKTVMALIKELEKSGSTDKSRMYLGGLSMGGMGTFELLRRKPDTFAAAFPICGGGHPAGAKKYAKKVNLWVFHGEEDSVVPVEKSTVMVEAIRQAGGEVKYTMYPGVNHNSWDYAFAEPELLPWLFSNHK